MLKQLLRCLRLALSQELPDAPHWDLFLASTTQKTRDAVARAAKRMNRGPRRVLQLPRLVLNRHSEAGVVGAMAEALLISRADIFMRLVVGTSGFSTFAYLSNALRFHNEWAAPIPGLARSSEMPNFVVTSDCGSGRCFSAPAEVRMAGISWHGEQYM